MAGCRPQYSPGTLPPDGKSILLNPITRVDGQLKAEVVVENSRIVEARLGTSMFRGFENILNGREPQDAVQLAQRICSQSSISHAIAASQALEEATNKQIPQTAHLIRNLIQAANFLQNHLSHFYLHAGPDFIPTAPAPLFATSTPQPDLRLDKTQAAQAEENYQNAMQVCQLCSELIALLSGRMPQPVGILAGGASRLPTADNSRKCLEHLKKIHTFVVEKHLPQVYTICSTYQDFFELGQTYRSCISVNAFPQKNAAKFLYTAACYQNETKQPFQLTRIKEHSRYAWFDAGNAQNSYSTLALPALQKAEAYSFIKAARYNGQPMETGPLARMWLANAGLSSTGQKELSTLFGKSIKTMQDLTEDNAFSVMGRHLARAEECHFLLKPMAEWMQALSTATQAPHTSLDFPHQTSGTGLIEAPEGSLLHTVSIADGHISQYQIISPGNWNSSPRDNSGQPGPMEKALLGASVPDMLAPQNVGIILRSFAPSLRCAAH